jgi:hypothetical protein
LHKPRKARRELERGMVIRKDCFLYSSSPLAWELPSYCRIHTAPEHQGISALFLCSRNTEGGQINRNNTKTIIMPYISSALRFYQAKKQHFFSLTRNTEKKTIKTPRLNLFPICEKPGILK